MINTGSLASALRPGVHQWFGAMYNRYPDEYAQIFDKEISNMNYEIDVNLHGFGLGVVKPEGENISYDTMQQGFKKTYYHIVYGLGFIITREAIEDNLYMKMAKMQAEALAVSMKQVKETVAANVLNRAFNSSYAGADGIELCSSVHLLSGGGTYANELATPSDLSEAALEQALIDIGGFVDDRSLKMQAQGMKLIVPRQLEFEAQRILNSEMQNDTANNAVNVLKSGRYLPAGHIVNHYLTDADAWFIKTNVPHGLMHFERRALQIDNDTDFDSDNMKFKATERYSFGFTDPRGIFGSEGAA